MGPLSVVPRPETTETTETTDWMEGPGVVDTGSVIGRGLQAADDGECASSSLSGHVDPQAVSVIVLIEPYVVLVVKGVMRHRRGLAVGRGDGRGLANGSRCLTSCLGGGGTRVTQLVTGMGRFDRTTTALARTGAKRGSGRSVRVSRTGGTGRLGDRSIHKHPLGT